MLDKAPDNLEHQKLLTSWRSAMTAALPGLRRMAGSTEKEFLRIGGALHQVYAKSLEITETSKKLVEVASGERIPPLVEKLAQIIADMENYLDQTATTAGSSNAVMESVGRLLGQVVTPLEGFRRMSKHLYMLEVSIKVESAYLGEKGSEFINLAMDIKKLSQQIKEKAGSLYDHRLMLAKLLNKHLASIAQGNRPESEGGGRTLSNMQNSLAELQEANSSFAQLGSEVASISEENSDHLSSVVQSMQFHDIFRQQVEHVIEAIEALLATDLPAGQNHQVEDGYRTAIALFGDVCELQEAQLQFAAGEFHGAVSTIIDNLQEIGARQNSINQNRTLKTTGSTGQSFVDEVSRHMATSVKLLEECSKQNDTTVAIMQEVTATVKEMSGFVAVIEEIGNEIIQISLNARIKAASTGTDGDSLSVLAEEIGFLSSEAVDRSSTITATLTEIHDETSTLAAQVNNLEHILAEKLVSLSRESSAVLATLKAMGGELTGLIKRTQNLTSPLSREIDKLCASIDVHQLTQKQANEVVATLKGIYRTARGLYPASDDFKEELRRMAEKYTMDSERRIHEAISNRHGVEMITHQHEPVDISSGDQAGEFGDNVDLF
jgi:methyl-accepting chemotaxis protein